MRKARPTPETKLNECWWEISFHTSFRSGNKRMHAPDSMRHDESLKQQCTCAHRAFAGVGLQRRLLNKMYCHADMRTPQPFCLYAAQRKAPSYHSNIASSSPRVSPSMCGEFIDIFDLKPDDSFLCQRSRKRLSARCRVDPNIPKTRDKQKTVN